jgi:nucleotide-binding universal stress UspA family protein
MRGTDFMFVCLRLKFDFFGDDHAPGVDADASRRIMLMNLLVPVDGSPASLRAVKLAIALASEKHDASIVLLNVQNIASFGLAEGAEIMVAGWIDEEEDRAAKEALKEAIAACEDAGMRFTVRMEKGAPAATIDRIAGEERADHIVMGTRGLGGIRGLLLGSVATQVLHLVNVPVTLVK